MKALWKYLAEIQARKGNFMETLQTETQTHSAQKGKPLRILGVGFGIAVIGVIPNRAGIAFMLNALTKAAAALFTAG